MGNKQLAVSFYRVLDCMQRIIQRQTDFSNLGLTLQLDGRVVQVGSTAALLGHPLRSLVAAARLAAEAGEPLQAGWIVMAGGATPAEWIKPGQYVSVEMQGLGQAGFHVQS